MMTTPRHFGGDAPTTLRLPMKSLRAAHRVDFKVFSTDELLLVAALPLSALPRPGHSSPVAQRCIAASRVQVTAEKLAQTEQHRALNAENGARAVSSGVPCLPPLNSPVQNTPCAHCRF